MSKRILRTAFVALILVFAATAAAGKDKDDRKLGKANVPLTEAEVYIEWNSTDTDFGIQFFWDSTGFTEMSVRNEEGEVLDVETDENVKAQGLTEGFFESVEPPADALSMAAFFARFPEGTYKFKGKSINGGRLVGQTEFTHVLPMPPANLFPEEDDEVSHDGFLAGFDPVTQGIDGNAVDIELYVVVVEKEESDPILQTFTVILPPSKTEVWVPGEFLEPNTEYKLEVIAQETSGNRTITEEGGFFTD